MESTHIRINDRIAVLVDTHEDGVWLHTYTSNGSMFAVLPKEKARDLIAALQQAVDA